MSQQLLDSLGDEDRRHLEHVVSLEDGPPTLDERVQAVQGFRGRSRERSRVCDAFLLTEVLRLGRGLIQARRVQEQLRGELATVLAPPLHPALLVRLLLEPEERARALVAAGTTQRVVTVAPDVDVDALTPGDEVYLGHELNVIVARAPDGVPPCGETAVFERLTDDGRLVLRSRDELVVVRSAASLAPAAVKPGDLVRWDRATLFAFERLDRGRGSHLFLEETPSDTFAEIGGLQPQIERLQRGVGLHMFHADVARRYRQRRIGSALLVGPPGTGKTKTARAFANWLAQRAASGRARFMNIKPAALHSPWYSQSEANYREAFRVAREAGAAEPEVPVVIFIDEVDAIGAARGQWGAHIDDRVQTAFMAELDGLEARGNVLVMAATNRRAALDPALLRPGRLGDLVIEIPRPTLAGAREILGKHLHPDIPIAADGADAAAARMHLIEATVSALYAPNADNVLATLRFRDGKQRIVRAADVLSGADLAQIAAAATARACVREVDGGEAGLRVDDLQGAAAEHLETLAAALRPATCRHHVSDLPDDVDVVAVDPVVRRVARPHRYLNVA